MPEFCEWERAVGLKQQRNLMNAQMFPNPCRDGLSVDLETGALPSRLRVMDQSDRVLREEELQSSRHKFNTSQLSQGLYLLEIRAEAGLFRGNFVVQR